MMRLNFRTITITGCFLFCTSLCFSQTTNDSIFKRLRGVNSRTVTSYNSDGISIFSSNNSYSFNSKNLKKLKRKFKIDKNLDGETISGLKANHNIFRDQESITKDLFSNNHILFIENDEKRTTVLNFQGFNVIEDSFILNLSELILKKAIPDSLVISDEDFSSEFAGRVIEFPKNVCEWASANNIRCPKNGQMDWSYHENLEQARVYIQHRLEAIKALKQGKVILEEDVEVFFEGQPTMAKKIVFDFTGITSVLASLSGGKTITVFNIAESIRNYNISCVLSYWNNDAIPVNGLPALLNEVMQFKDN